MCQVNVGKRKRKRNCAEKLAVFLLFKGKGHNNPLKLYGLKMSSLRTGKKL